MAVRRNAATPARRGPGRPRKAPAEAPATKDLSQYADKPATGYHKAFAGWLVREVGVDLNGMSVKSAFLKGVSLATTTRAAWASSDALVEYREKSGESKPGRKPAAERSAPPARKRRPEPEPEPEQDDDDFEDESDDFDDEAPESDDDFDGESDDADDFDDDEEPAPAPKKRAPVNKRSAAKRAPASRRPAAKKPAADDDDEFMF
jgi:hypothetical protein